MLLFFGQARCTTQIHILSAVGTIADTRKRIDFLMLSWTTFVFAKLLHQIKFLLSDDRLMGILEDQPFLFRVVHTFLVFVGLHMSTEVDRVSTVFLLFENVRDRFHSPAVEVGVLMSVVSAL